jgi:hypothetical protein
VCARTYGILRQPYLVWWVLWRCTPPNDCEDVATEQHLDDADTAIVETTAELEDQISTVSKAWSTTQQATCCTHRFFERLAIVHPEAGVCSASKATVILIESDVKKLRPGPTAFHCPFTFKLCDLANISAEYRGQVDAVTQYEPGELCSVA